MLQSLAHLWRISHQRCSKGQQHHNYDIKIAFEQKFVQIGVLHLDITATKFAFNSSIHFVLYTEGYGVIHIAVLLMQSTESNM